MRTLVFWVHLRPGGARCCWLSASSGVIGVLLALAQHDLKRLLAYHSVENIGIITLGLGIGVLGQSHGQPTVAFFGFAGALLHVLNHALFKGLLFQAAGCVLLRTGERNINALGGLSKRMPITSALFLTAAVAICGIPPLNGFVSEWLVYLGAFRGSSLPWAGTAMLSIIGLVSLALIGGLALACFVKAHSVVFLGEPRSAAGQAAREVGPLLLAPMATLALLCVIIGLFPALALWIVAPVVRVMTGDAGVPVAAFAMARSLSRTVLVVLGVVAILALIRVRLLRGRAVTCAPTWGCGYAAPSPRMQYSAGSFAAPVLATFRRMLATRESNETADTPFPARAAYFSVKYHDIAASRGSKHDRQGTPTHSKRAARAATQPHPALPTVSVWIAYCRALLAIHFRSMNHGGRASSALLVGSIDASAIGRGHQQDQGLVCGSPRGTPAAALLGRVAAPEKGRRVQSHDDVDISR